MLALVILLTIFIGLVGLLAVIGECQKRLQSSKTSTNGTSSSKDSLSFEEVGRWLLERHLPTPTTQQVISLLNDSLQTISFKEWKEMKLEELSTLPNIQVSSVSNINDNSIRFQCKLENMPEVGVVCVSGDGERVVCRLEMEWLYALVQVTFTKDNDHLLVSVQHNEPVRMSFCCAPRDSVKDGERLASSVADELQMWFESLKISNAVIRSRVPSLVVSDHDDEGPDDLEVGPNTDPITEQSQQSGTPEASQSDWTTVDKPPSDWGAVEKLPSDWSTIDEAVSESPSTPVFEEKPFNGESAERKEVVEGSRPPPLMAVVEEEEEGRGTPQSDRYLPLSPAWRRSPSYEQLQQIQLDPQRLLQSFGRGNHASPPHLAGPDKRALTLSVSGSEAESVYGADERIPSTLVYEITDSTSKVRHIVAVTPAHAVKLRRRYPQAKKLHIYNDHCFTATHIKKRTECGVCGSKISGRFGKQAYICEDCSIVVHKHCHFKVDGQCAQSNLHQMNLIYPDNTSTASAN